MLHFTPAFEGTPHMNHNDVRTKARSARNAGNNRSELLEMEDEVNRVQANTVKSTSQKRTPNRRLGSQYSTYSPTWTARGSQARPINPGRRFFVVSLPFSLNSRGLSVGRSRN